MFHLSDRELSTYGEISRSWSSRRAWWPRPCCRNPSARGRCRWPPRGLRPPDERDARMSPRHQGAAVMTTNVESAFTHSALHRARNDSRRRGTPPACRPPALRHTRWSHRRQICRCSPPHPDLQRKSHDTVIPGILSHIFLHKRENKLWTFMFVCF